MAQISCPSCKKPVILVTRCWNTSKPMATAEFHHTQDVQKWKKGSKPKPCKVRMTFEESQGYMEAVAALR